MIETIIQEYLDGVLTVPVLFELPEVPSADFEEWPDKFVVIELVGKSKTDHVYTASFAFQSYSISRLYDAAELDSEVQAAIEEMPAATMIGGVKLTSNYNFTDARTKRYRYQSVYDVSYV